MEIQSKRHFRKINSFDAFQNCSGVKVLGTIEGDKETGMKRLEELDQGTGTEEVVGEMY